MIFVPGINVKRGQRLLCGRRFSLSARVITSHPRCDLPGAGFLALRRKWAIMPISGKMRGWNDKSEGSLG